MTIEEQYAAFQITEELRDQFNCMEKEYNQCTNSTTIITRAVILNSDKNVKEMEVKQNA
jgi:hypothetical protein